jgi:hypothetical protein
VFTKVIIPVAAYETITTLLNIYIILTAIALGKLRVKTAVIFALITMAPFSVIALIPELSDSLRVIILPLPAIFCAAAPILSVAGMKKRTILYISLMYISFSTAVISPFIWISGVFGWGAIGNGILDILINLALLLLCIFTARGKILSRTVIGFMGMPKYVRNLLCVTFWVYSAFVAYASTFFRTHEDISNIAVLEFLSAMVVLLISVMCPLMIAHSISDAISKSQLIMMARQVKAQTEHYAASVKADGDMRIFRHDFRHLKIGLTELLHERDFDGALRMLDKCEEPFAEYSSLYNTGDTILDALLRDKQAQARGSNALICFEGAIVPGSLLPTTVCAIFGNAIDNAMHACQEIPDADEKTICVTASYRNHFLSITVTNPVQKDIRIRGNTLPTTKADKFAHGIGLISINNVAQEHGGSMRISCANKVFTIAVELETGNHQNHPDVPTPVPRPKRLLHRRSSRRSGREVS